MINKIKETLMLVGFGIFYILRFLTIIAIIAIVCAVIVKMFMLVFNLII